MSRLRHPGVRSGLAAGFEEEATPRTGREGREGGGGIVAGFSIVP
jgi:hypothetical protein